MDKQDRNILIIFIIIILVSVLLAVIYPASKAKLEQTQYTVSANDTLWNIAERYKAEGTDTRDYIYNITKINNITADIYEGQIITILKEVK